MDTSKKEDWFLAKINNKEEVKVTYNTLEKGIRKQTPIALLTYNASTEKFTLYQIDRDKGELIRMGRGPSPEQLEKKFVKW